MGVINLEDLESGMVLAADAKARNGRVLLNAGSVLTEKHLHIFKAWGVTEADIQGVSRQDVAATAEAQADPRALERAQAVLKERFRQFWGYTYLGAAQKFFARWFWQATHSQLKPMAEVAKLIQCHLPNILTYLRHGSGHPCKHRIALFLHRSLENGAGEPAVQDRNVGGQREGRVPRGFRA